MDDVDMMREVLTADDPLVVLYPAFTETIKAHRDAWISAQRLSLDDPSRGTTELVTFDSGDIKNLRALNSANGWWTVLLPGWGPAWVEQSHVAMTSAPIQPPATVRARTTLCLSHAISRNHEVILRFFSTVGSHVKTLRLVDNFGPVKLHDAIFKSCPHLEELELRGSELD